MYSGSQCLYPSQIQPREKHPPQSSKLRSGTPIIRDPNTNSKVCGQVWRNVLESDGLINSPVNTPCPPPSQTHLVKAKEQGTRKTISRWRKCDAHCYLTASPPHSGAWEMPSMHSSSYRGVDVQRYLNLQPILGNFRVSVAWGWGHRLRIELPQPEVQLHHLLAIWSGE